ncbi:NADP-dependent oxidoreductase [Chitinophaga sp. Cy-1792]|uniref:NADP-dependent oxidoreductase n=1 Tax=Chitinophaga sp. Cy-1792 TaxID=2608339 RepID=UPI001421093A|nr:NADP-dependent oxidoreductase [Chitinophaga sp. Cy-1792]NIG56161.1 NADP-dependent oxidoreductase [Chitinophaga sp. Cy-1792]
MKIQQIILAARPHGLPDNTIFEFITTDLADPGPGEVLIKPVYYSVDPYMRGRMNAAKSYIPPFEVGAPIESGAIAMVEESNDKGFQKGDYVMLQSSRPLMPWTTAAVYPATSLRKLDPSLPPTWYLGIAGMPGLTAYFGLTDIGKPKSGDTLVISGAAGAVGLAVGQIGKIYGCRVIGIAGGAEKVKMLTDNFNFDAAIDYKNNKDIKGAIASVCPNGVDIYFDNVGGDISDAVMPNLNFHSRVVLCGQISMYNETEQPIGPRVQPLMVTRSILMQGFIIGDYAPRFGEGIKQLATWLHEGKIRNAETVTEGFDKLPEALLGLFSGKNSGKMIVKV